MRLPGGREAPFAIDPFARHCLLNGVDELGYLLSQLPAIEAWERRACPRVKLPAASPCPTQAGSLGSGCPRAKLGVI